jgi:hypothetical protein
MMKKGIAVSRCCQCPGSCKDIHNIATLLNVSKILRRINLEKQRVINAYDIKCKSANQL